MINSEEKMGMKRVSRSHDLVALAKNEELKHNEEQPFLKRTSRSHDLVALANETLQDKQQTIVHNTCRFYSIADQSRKDNEEASPPSPSRRLSGEGIKTQ